MNASAQSATAPTRILIAEDSPTQAMRLKRTLEQAGYHVTHAANGRHALDAARQHKPRLIVSDINMPEMDGYELCRHVKSDATLARTSVILVTNLSDPQHLLNSLECGADSFIVKPYDERYLLRQVEIALGESEVPRAALAEEGVEVVFHGQKHRITFDRARIVKILLSTYDAALQRNDDLIRSQEELRVINGAFRKANARLLVSQEALARTNMLLQEINMTLETRVAERTAEVRAMTEQLWQAAKLATLGELAASIAHELNNPLATVGLRVEGLLAGEEEGSSRHASLRVIDGEVERMTSLVAGLLQFSHRSTAHISTVDLRNEVTKTLDLVSHRLKAGGVQVAVEIPPGLPPLFVDRQKLRQILLNLFTNAADAMSDGGWLTVAALPNGGDELVLEVRDTGCGIRSEHLEKIMEPFFTTKPEGKGTGLGLPICKRIAEEHGGRMEIFSVHGQGTTVRIILPINHDRSDVIESELI